MKPFITSCLAVCSLLVLPSFAHTADFEPSSAASASTGTNGATLKVQTVSTTVTTTINGMGERTEMRVTQLSCGGAAFDCKLNRAGEATYAPPTIGL